jgi:toxin ParE1/3/4
MPQALRQQWAKVAADPEGPATRGRPELQRGIRCIHLRHVQAGEQSTKVKRPVHILYYRVIRPGLVEIVRVLHERMEPGRHIGLGSDWPAT